MSLLDAHLICLALVAVDLITRAWRFQWILRGLEFRVGFGEVLALNTVGDAAAAVSPLRLAGEPVRLAALARARVPLSAGIVAATYEVAIMWPVIFAAAGWLALIYAPRWWRAAGPMLGHSARDAWPWVAAIVAASAIGWWVARRFFPRASLDVQRGTRRAFAYARRMPAWPLVAAVPLTLLSVAARVGILVVLALTLREPPAIGPLSFGSFALLYSQNLLPTPSGAGVVDFGFVGGAVGNLGAHHRHLLVLWRFYTTLLLVGLGGVIALLYYGLPILRARRAAARRAGGRTSSGVIVA